MDSKKLEKLLLGLVIAGVVIILLSLFFIQRSQDKGQSRIDQGALGPSGSGTYVSAVSLFR